LNTKLLKFTKADAGPRGEGVGLDEIIQETHYWPARTKGRTWAQNYNRQNYFGLRATFNPENSRDFYFPFFVASIRRHILFF